MVVVPGELVLRYDDAPEGDARAKRVDEGRRFSGLLGFLANRFDEHYFKDDSALYSVGICDKEGVMQIGGASSSIGSDCYHFVSRSDAESIGGFSGRTVQSCELANLVLVRKLLGCFKGEPRDGLVPYVARLMKRTGWVDNGLSLDDMFMQQALADVYRKCVFIVEHRVEEGGGIISTVSVQWKRRPVNRKYSPEVQHGVFYANDERFSLTERLGEDCA
ncbi:hypothetical protein HY489_03275 [Candidatus Woesearchaeota archaeon]|nr:hypothetical protein [Candidatus Woesearchaeota archaeon]